MQRKELNLFDCAPELLRRMEHGGVLCTVCDDQGATNIITLGWGLVGRSYHGNPIITIAVSPPRYSWRFLEKGEDFVLALPDDALADAVRLCGVRSGRELDKFAAAGLRAVPSVHVRAPSIAQCPVNIECRLYARVQPPHMLLTPEHRQAPAARQHTIYFAEVLGTYGWVDPTHT